MGTEFQPVRRPVTRCEPTWLAQDVALETERQSGGEERRGRMARALEVEREERPRSFGTRSPRVEEARLGMRSASRRDVVLDVAALDARLARGDVQETIGGCDEAAPRGLPAFGLRVMTARTAVGTLGCGSGEREDRAR